MSLIPEEHQNGIKISTELEAQVFFICLGLILDGDVTLKDGVWKWIGDDKYTRKQLTNRHNTHGKQD